MAKARSKPISSHSEWTHELIQRYDLEIGRVARHYGLDCYPHLIEIITAEQMMDAYASVGMPVNYHHWSFGKHYLTTENRYLRGEMGLAYEIVINSDPCIAYLMEENTMTMQALVIAHAAYGHNSFFKGNYLFRTWTSADTIIDYMVFAHNYIAECEERYGEGEVERLLDACHALLNVGVDRYRRPPRLSLLKEKERQKEREAYLQSQVNELWRTLPAGLDRKDAPETGRFPSDPEENLLYFFEKNAPLLEPWQREVIRIVRKIGQYFLPQRQTQLMNEGWACFWHYTILNHLYDEGLLADGFMMEFLKSHTSVVHQPAYNSRQYGGINPYALGFAMWRDIRRICETPTAEDRHWFPDWAGHDWQEAVSGAMRNFKDESFIAQYLSPNLMRGFRLFAVVDDDRRDKLRVESIHDEMGYQSLRETLSDQYNLGGSDPNIQIWNVDLQGDRSLTLRHFLHKRRPLADSRDQVLQHVATLWGFPVILEEQDESGTVRIVKQVVVDRRKTGS
jgi:stage V sporulation protein R